MAETPDGFIHITGDVYWKQNAGTAVLLVVFAAMVLVGPETWIDTFPGVAGAAFERMPRTFLWAVQNWTGLAWFALGVGLTAGIRFKPDAVTSQGSSS